jgi:hypothetical protein
VAAPRRAGAPRISTEQAIAAAIGHMELAAGGVEVGSDDFRISEMGGDEISDARDPAIAYNSADNEFLVVWSGNDATPPLAADEREVYGRLVDAATGSISSADVRLSDMGPDGDSAYNAFSPAAAYNPATGEYLVVWEGTDDAGAQDVSEREIYAQRVNADGLEVGTNDVRLSSMGSDGESEYDANDPAIVFNADANQFLVVWWGDDSTGALVNDEFEIYGQRLTSLGAETGTDDFRISQVGDDGDPDYFAQTPDVTYNSAAGEYLVVWAGNTDFPTFDPGETEIIGQRLSAGGASVGTDDFALSSMGAPLNSSYDAADPAATYNVDQNEYLVVWSSDDNAGGVVNDEFEIFGQRLSAVGIGLGTDDFRISDMGPNGDVGYGAERPDVTYDAGSGGYLVTWTGADNINGLVQSEEEMFGQRLDELGAEVGGNDFRLSNSGPNGDATFDVDRGAVAYGSAPGIYLVVWAGEDDAGALVDNEYEIFGQRLKPNGNEEGRNDFRISHMGGDREFDAASPAAAYNPLLNEYLVVWAGDNNDGAWIDGEFEIYGRRVNAATGAIVGDDIRLSSMGPVADTDYAGQQPDVAYNSAANEYLVVWSGSDDSGSLTVGELEIYGQRVSALGAEVGVDDFRISDMGTDGNAAIDALAPAAVYNSQSNEFLVVWYGDDDAGALVDEEFEIYGQRLSAAGAPLGTNDFRISAAGPDGNSSYSAILPAAAHNSSANEYLVVWHADTNAGELVNDEFEIYGQRLNAAGTATGADDFRLSQMGADGNAADYGILPGAAYLAATDEYLVVWQGVNDSLALGETEIFGQRLDGAGALVGAAGFQISDTGPVGDGDYDAFTPVVTAGQAGFLVVWRADTEAGGLADEEFEIYGRQVSATGGIASPSDFRLSSMGPDGNPAFDALGPAAAFNATDETYLIVWQGDDDEVELVDDEFEIFGQQYAAGFGLWLPLVSK